MDGKLRMWTSGAKKSENFKVTPLSENMAIDTGADMLGEVFIFSVGASVIALEYWRQTTNSARKEKKNDETLVKLRKDINQLTDQVANQKASIDELTRLLESLQGKHFSIVPVNKSNGPIRLQ